MSQQQKKNDYSEKLMISADGQLKASQKIPQIARPFVSEKALKYLDIVSSPHDFPQSQALTEASSRSRSLSKKNAFPPTPYSNNRLATRQLNASAATPPSSKTSRSVRES